MTRPTLTKHNRARGVLMGLAVGDAFGAPVEFMHRSQILEKFGPDGIADLKPWGGFDAGSYTDDTQMSVATARGILDWREASGWTPTQDNAPNLRALAAAIWERAPCSMRTWAERRGVTPQFIHSGGHAWPEDLHRLARAIEAKETVWVHTDWGGTDAPG